MANVPNLSLCARTMLAAIVTSETPIDPDALRVEVPYTDAWLGVADAAEWFEALQELLDANFVRRVEQDRRYCYQVTGHGLVFHSAFISLPERRRAAR